MPEDDPTPHPRGHVVAIGVVLVVITTLVAFIATHGFGRFDRRVDVLLIGDSIMSQAGPFVSLPLQQAPGIGSASVRVEATPGTGLLTPKLMDWPARAQQLVDTYRPRVVVVSFNGNYTDVPEDLWPGADGQPIPNTYGDAFWSEWQGQAERLTDILVASGAKVVWVLPPPFVGAEGARREQHMRQAYTAIAHTHAEVSLADGRAALGGPNGEFVSERAGIDGEVVVVRAPDTVHLTEPGARLLADEIVDAVAALLRSIRQQDRRPA